MGYRPALDGVRAIAIATVVAFHTVGWPREGTLGVDLFFVLSGFLITTLLLEEHSAGGTISIRRFYARRARRLLPALFALLVPYAVAGASLLGLVAALTYTTNVAVAINSSFMPPGLIHLWSLAAEEQFYLVWPLLLLVLLRAGGRRIVGRALLVLLAVAIAYRLQLLLRGASIERLYYAPDTHADSLIVGCAFACWRPRWSSALGTPALAVVLGAVCFGAGLPVRLQYSLQLVPTLFACVAGFLVVSAVDGSGLVGRLLSNAPLVFLGQISYSLYLWHLPIVSVLHVHHHAGARAAIAVVASVAIASASRYCIELPCLARRGPKVGRAGVAGHPVALPVPLARRG